MRVLSHGLEIIMTTAFQQLRGHGAQWRLTGCTLAVTLEPCTMCAGAVPWGRLVYGTGIESGMVTSP